MAALFINRTDKTPEVDFNPLAGTLKLDGCSIPEDADRFYGPLFELLERYCQAPAPHTTIAVALNYFNSSSSKYLLDLLRLVDELHVSGKANATLEWYFEPDDLDMEEAGQDYRSLLEMPVKLIARAIR